MERIGAGDLVETLRLMVDGASRNRPPSDGDSAECPECHGQGIVTEWRTEPDGYAHMVGRLCPTCWPAEQKARAAARAARISAECGLGELQREMTLDSFEVYPGNERVLAAARKFSASPLGEWLLIAGRTGNGKTHLLSAIANAAIVAVIPTLYAYVPQLLDHLREGFSIQETREPWWTGDRDPDTESFRQRWERVLEVDLLLLDDLGVEVTRPWVVERFEILFDARIRNRRATAITTNLSVSELRRMSERVFSRIERYPATIVRNEAQPFHERKRKAG